MHGRGGAPTAFGRLALTTAIRQHAQTSAQRASPASPAPPPATCAAPLTAAGWCFPRCRRRQPTTIFYQQPLELSIQSKPKQRDVDTSPHIRCAIRHRTAAPRHSALVAPCTRMHRRAMIKPKIVAEADQFS